MARLPRSHNSRSLRVIPVTNSLVPSDTPGEISTLVASANYQPIWAGECIGAYAFWIDVGTGLTGTFSIQGTLVPDPELTTDLDWTNITPTVVGSPLAYTGTAGNTYAFGVDQMWEWLRLKFAFTSGTGTVRAFCRVDDNR